LLALSEKTTPLRELIPLLIANTIWLNVWHLSLFCHSPKYEVIRSQIIHQEKKVEIDS
jgi:hypothetical protein